MIPVFHISRIKKSLQERRNRLARLRFEARQYVRMPGDLPFQEKQKPSPKPPPEEELYALEMDAECKVNPSDCILDIFLENTNSSLIVDLYDSMKDTIENDLRAVFSERYYEAETSVRPNIVSYSVRNDGYFWQDLWLANWEGKKMTQTPKQIHQRLLDSGWLHDEDGSRGGTGSVYYKELFGGEVDPDDSLIVKLDFSLRKMED